MREEEAAKHKHKGKKSTEADDTTKLASTDIAGSSVADLSKLVKENKPAKKSKKKSKKAKKSEKSKKK